MIGVWMFHTGIGVRLRHMGIKVPLRRTRIGVGLRHTGIRVRLFHMVGMVRFCGAVFPYGFEGAPVRILGMVPGPGLSYGLSYAVGIRKPFQVINILPPSPGDNWDGFRRGAANTAPWDASGLFLLYWAQPVEKPPGVRGPQCSSQRSRCVGPWGLPGAPLLTGLPPRSSRHWRRSALPSRRL